MEWTMTINEFVFKDELMDRIHMILRNHEVVETSRDVIYSDSIPNILTDIKSEMNKLISTYEER